MLYIWEAFYIGHRPSTLLLSIFSPNKGLPIFLANRLQRWAQFLSNYDYDITYVSSNKNKADWLSRLPINTDFEDENVNYLLHVENSEFNLNFKKIRHETGKYPILAKVVRFVLNGWPNVKLAQEFQPFVNKKNELSLEQGCLMWGFRIIVPPIFQNKILNELHSSHMGIVKTKSLARSYVWWPKMDKDIEKLVGNCDICLAFRSLPEKAALKVYEWPKEPWKRIHCDFFGPILHKYFLVFIDAHSKWIECFVMPNITTSATIDAFRECFARFGLPIEVCTDKGAQFTANECQNYFKVNGIKHLTGAPFHPSSNGEAESAVKIMKNAILKAIKENRNFNLKSAISRFLFHYRNTKHSTTGESPAKLLLNRQLRSNLDQMLPSTNTVVND